MQSLAGSVVNSIVLVSLFSSLTLAVCGFAAYPSGFATGGRNMPSTGAAQISASVTRWFSVFPVLPKTEKHKPVIAMFSLANVLSRGRRNVAAGLARRALHAGDTGIFVLLTARSVALARQASP